MSSKKKPDAAISPSPRRGEGRVRGIKFARQLRRDQTPHEAKIWSRLRDRRLEGYKFRRQHPIGPYIADFYCAEARLIVELDGSGHADQAEYDQARTDWLQANGYHVMRFTNLEVDRSLDAVLTQVLAACRSSAKSDISGGSFEETI